MLNATEEDILIAAGFHFVKVIKATVRNFAFELAKFFSFYSLPLKGACLSPEFYRQQHPRNTSKHQFNSRTH